MRLQWFNTLTVLCAAACTASPPGPAPPARSTSRAAAAGSVVNPANIQRLRGAFPPGYEAADANGTSSPTRFWGLGADWSADPGQCASLADPLGGQVAAPHGLSGSGPGGTVYVVVAGAAAPPVVADPAVIDACAKWTMAGARTTATVELTPAPSIDDATTLAMSTAARTVVEGGTKTETHAQTATAYLGDYLVFVTVVTDPGFPLTQLPPDFASTFLVRTVATLRGSPAR